MGVWLFWHVPKASQDDKDLKGGGGLEGSGGRFQSLGGGLEGSGGVS